jgi:hypothetical protein
MNSCLAAQISFLLFKGPGSFKTIFKIGENVDELKAFRLIPLTPPLLFHFTLPLSRTDNINISPFLKNQIRFFLQLKFFPIICNQKPGSDSGFTKKSGSGYVFTEYRSEKQFSIAGYRPWTKELERNQTLKLYFLKNLPGKAFCGWPLSI